MCKTLWAILAFLFLSLPSFAQTSTVTATITDSDSIAWANGTYSITYVQPAGNSSPPIYNGVPMTPAQKGPYTGTMDGSGAMSVALPDNSFITPPGSSWLFILCPNASFRCSQITATAIGTTVNYTTLFSNGVVAPRFSATSSGAYGYSTVEINQVPLPGGSFWNVTVQCTDTWNGSAFACGSGSGTGNVTASGTLTAGQPVLGAGAKAVQVGPINLAGGASYVANLLPVPNGGLGVGTITGVIKGNGTSPVSAAVAADIVALWNSGMGCTSIQSLGGMANCLDIPSIGTGTQFALTDWATTSSLGSIVGNVTGQIPVAQNGAAPSFISAGIADGNGGAAVTTTPYAVACDSATTTLDRTTTIRFQSGASVINIPAHTTSGCGSNMSFVLINDGAGTLTVNRGGSDTFTVVDGATNTDGATSFTFGSGQYATANNGASGIWEVRKVVQSSSPAFNNITSGTNTAAAMLVGTGASLGPTGSGTINSTAIGGITVTGTPSTGYVPTATSSSAATWQAPSGGGYATIENNGTAVAQQTTFNLIPAGSANISVANNSGASRTDITITGVNGAASPTVNTISGTSYTIANSDNAWRDVFTNSGAVAVTLPQANTVATSPFVATRISSGSSSACTTCMASAFSQNAGDTLIYQIQYANSTATVSGVTDSAGDTWTRLTADQLNGLGTFVYSQSTWIAKGVSASASNVVSTTMSSATTINQNLVEYNVVQLDNAAGATSSAPSVTIPVSFPAEVAVSIDTAVSACSSGWTYRTGGGGAGNLICERLLSAVSTVTDSHVSAGSNPSIALGDFAISASPVFTAGWYVVLENTGTGIETVTTTTSTINGRSTLVLVPNEICSVMSDGTNYNAICHFIPNEQVNGLIGGPIQQGKLDADGATSALTASVIAATTATAAYRVNVGIECTAAAAAATVVATIGWTDPSSNAQVGAVGTATCTTLGVAGANVGVSVPIRAKTGTNITVTTVIANGPTYSYHADVEQLSTN